MPLELQSDSSLLNRMFPWAIRTALSLVQTGRRGVVDRWERGVGGGDHTYIPCYWAGYRSRTAFYSRDFCHQAVGAHLLGLDTENATMLRTFAGSATAARKGFPLWAFNFDGSPFRLDWRGDHDFVREVPATFELVELVWKLHRWTGDRGLLGDPQLRRYAEQTLGEFIRWHDDRRPNGIAEGDGSGDIFSGSATYNEVHADHPLVEAGDGVACQWAAMDAWARWLAALGDRGAGRARKRAAEFQKQLNTVWGVQPGFPGWVRGYDVQGRPWTDFGLENSWFLPLKGAALPGERTTHLLDLIERAVDNAETRPSNLEAISYLPGVFHAWDRNETAWRWLRHIMDAPLADREYPEISYTLIAHVVEGLLGLEPDAAGRRFTTVSRLPKEIGSLEVRDVPVGDARVSLRHQGALGSEATLVSSDGRPWTWTARFPGGSGAVRVDGRARRARTVAIRGNRFREVDVNLPPGRPVRIDAV
ncbi:MAG: hypothetical protein ACKO5K_10340 [Armatimonadota bacterium]